MKQTTIKRAPTPAERKRFQAALAETNIEQERTFWNPIVDQLRGQADIVSAVDLLKAVRESQGVSLRTLEETAGIPRGNCGPNISIGHRRKLWHFLKVTSQAALVQKRVWWPSRWPVRHAKW